MKCLLSKGALKRQAEGKLPGGTSGPKLHLQVGKQTPEKQGYLVKLGREANLRDSNLVAL